MKKKYYQNNLIEESKRAILKKYANDIRLVFSNEGYEEYWIGERGTTTLKALMWNDNKKGEGDGWLIDYGFTAKSLRADTHFVKTCLCDSDVNHALDEIPSSEGNEELFKLEMPCAKQLFYWYLGFTDKIPITPCGMENYSEYLVYPE